ncbi:WD repeat-containing protein 17-like [Tubulanus polymorphus]|uniref:WD repeat-containing protein 17-like n=1 Tax=Tubulanus polymorphus TaxID=672921 RepID=UPI003DA68103
MSKVKQVGLLAAGCQPWNGDVCAASGDRFAYCATLAVYIYQYDRKFNQFNLHSIMSEHKKTIIGISWNPHNVDLFVTAGADYQVIIWHVAEQRAVAKLDNLKSIPSSVGWCPHERECIAFISQRGPLLLWNYSHGGITQHKHAQNFLSEVCQFRWHHRKMGKIAFGHMDGSISMCCTGQRPEKHFGRPDITEGSEESDSVTDLQWDPLSTSYLLVANTSTDVRLIDTDSLTVIMTFQLPSVAAQVHAIAWISTAPGMFLTGDLHSGVMRLWNVSKPTPIENIKLKKCGFHCLHVISTPTSTPNSHHSDTGYSSANSSYTLPPGHAMCTFLDGGIGLYDLGRRKWNFIRDYGHIETIFDCKFKPDNADLLATSSFDGTIKVWNVDTLTAVHTSPGNEGVIYSISWAPSDLNCIAACTSRNGAFIWDITKGKVIQRYKEHGRNAVYSVAWNHKDSRRLASCGADGYCIIRLIDGELLQKYRHPGAVFGCDWSTNNKDMIATGCEDKCVRVFYMATNTDQPLKVFAGHTAKVFNVKWSPLREGILCSGSDDGTIRVWDYTQDACINVLVGHTAPVRGLLWNTEIPYLLISGSWDYSVRVWDTRDGAAIDVILDHGADVYGLTCHPLRPFLLASCSRDSTVRLWSLTPLVQPLELNIIAQRPFTEVMGTTEHAMNLGTRPLLTGKVSKEYKSNMDELPGDLNSRTLLWFSKFFMHPGGTSNLWELVFVVNGGKHLSNRYSTGIMHMDHLTKFKASEAQQLEMARVNKYGSSIGAPSRDHQLREAAHLYICLGNVEKYCELLVELGEWEKALAVAPGVSFDYWKSLAERRCQILMQENSVDVIPYSVATGGCRNLVKYFTDCGQLSEAMLMALVAYEGLMPSAHSNQEENHLLQNGVKDEHSDEQLTRLLIDASNELAEWYFSCGSPIKAACCHLAVNDCKQTLAKLIRGNELELAACVGLVLKDTSSKPLTCVALQLLSRKCENIGKWELAVDLLKMIPNNEWDLVKLCARCASSMAEIDNLHEKAGLPNLEECMNLSHKLRIKEDVWDYVKYSLLSTTPELGMQVGLSFVKECLKKESWVADDVFDMLQLLASIRTDRLQQFQNNTMCSEMMSLCSYIGALVAIRRSYDSIVLALFRSARHVIDQEQVLLNILKSEQIEQDASVWAAKNTQTDKAAGDRKRFGAELQPLYEELLRKCGEETWPVGIGPDIVASSHLPSHSDVHVSYLTGQRIQGTPYFLEDAKSAISQNDALMWSKVNPFSPLCSGMRLNPF